MKNCIVVLIFGILSSTMQSAAQHGHHTSSPDKPSVHGMLIFGKEKIYASHLPLFHPPHDYQIILELELSKEAKKQFIKDQQLHPEQTTYSIEPEQFILPDKISSKGSFKANLCRGHFERGGVKIADSVTVKISAVLYFKKFNPADTKLSTTDFILFGNSKEQFAIHQLSNKPDFEQIIQVFTKARLPDGKADLFTINEKENSPVGVGGNEVAAMLAGSKQKITLLKQLYLEFEDMKE
jgi:hypothetical protein